MKKLILLAFIALAASSGTGCATRMIELPDGSIIQRREVMPQKGVVVAVFNNCAPWLVIDSHNGREVSALSYSRKASIPIPARFVVGNRSSREIWVTARAYSGPPSDTTYIGLTELRERVSNSQGTRDRPWQVDTLRSPRGAQCPSALQARSRARARP